MRRIIRLDDGIPDRRESTKESTGNLGSHRMGWSGMHEWGVIG